MVFPMYAFQTFYLWMLSRMRYFPCLDGTLTTASEPRQSPHNQSGRRDSMAQQRTVDVHNHLYPKEYLDFLAGRKGKQHRAEQTGPNSYLLWDEDVIIAHIDRAGHYDPVQRIADLDKAGLDTQVMSKTIPDPSVLPRDEGIYWSTKVNDHYAEVCAKYPHRLYSMACLPYQDVDAACKELERCIKLGVKGIQMFSNCNGEVMWNMKF